MEQIINVDRMEQAEELFGSFDENAKIIEKQFGVHVVFRDSRLKVSGDEEKVALAVRTLQSLITLINSGERLTEQNIRYCIRMVEEDSEGNIAKIAGDVIAITSKGKPIKPKTVGQKTYCEDIKKNTITIGVGPAGTGKTYLAVAHHFTMWRRKFFERVQRLIAHGIGDGLPFPDSAGRFAAKGRPLPPPAV